MQVWTSRSLWVWLWLSVAVWHLNWQDGGEITGGSEAICLLRAWACPGETDSLYYQSRASASVGEGQGSEYFLLPRLSDLLLTEGALRVFCDGDWDLFSPLGLWVEATDLKTHGSDPFKYAAYSEWGAACLGFVSILSPLTPGSFLPFRYFAFSPLCFSAFKALPSWSFMAGELRIRVSVLPLSPPVPLLVL